MATETLAQRTVDEEAAGYWRHRFRAAAWRSGSVCTQQPCGRAKCAGCGQATTEAGHHVTVDRFASNSCASKNDRDRRDDRKQRLCAAAVGAREAGVVFEGIAEAGITRFLALYQEAKPANIGPIRSVRPYFLQWALGFDAPLAHVGGSPEALADINSWHVKNLDEFYNAAYYHRISSREAPHNMYTSMARLNTLEKTKGWTTSHFTGFTRKKDAPSKNPNATSIGSPFRARISTCTTTITPKSIRTCAGKAVRRTLTPRQANSSNRTWSLRWLFRTGWISDGYHSDYSTLGSGKAYVFQDAQRNNRRVEKAHGQKPVPVP